MPNSLTPFEGQDVVSVSLILTKLGDGLSDAVAIDASEYHHGDRIKVLVDAEVSKVRFDPIKDTDVLSRVHIAAADTAVIVDPAAVEAILEKHRAALDELRGQPQIDFDGVPDEADGDDDWDDGALRPLTVDEKGEADAGTSEAD